MLCAIVLFIGLGSWQVARKQWKEHVVAQIEAAQQMLPLTQLSTQPEALVAQEFRKILFSGTYFPERSLYLGGRFRDGDSGYFVLTPLHIKGDGRAVLVNRGFIPSAMRKTFEGLQYNGRVVQVEGVVRLPRQKKKFLPNNNPENNVWFWEDLGAMQDKTGLALLPIIIEATSNKESEEYPLPSRGKISIRNDHLGYAITWFILAGVALVMLLIYRRTRKPAA